MSEWYVRATGSVFLGLGVYLVLDALNAVGEDTWSLKEIPSTLAGVVGVAIGTPMVFGHNILGLERR